jgi:DNA-binding IclR family transcriptional regulator
LLNYVREDESIPRAEIVRDSVLQQSTVWTIAGALVAVGLIKEADDDDNLNAFFQTVRLRNRPGYFWCYSITRHD